MTNGKAAAEDEKEEEEEEAEEEEEEKKKVEEENKTFMICSFRVSNVLYQVSPMPVEECPSALPPCCIICLVKLQSYNKKKKTCNGIKFLNEVQF